MIPEKEFKAQLLNRLTKIHKDWVDGDLFRNQKKTVDLINHKLKIAIEIKDETVHKRLMPTPEEPLVVRTTDLNRMATILLDHIRDARKKFINYSNYKTILIIRSDHGILGSIIYAIEGFHTFTETSYVGKKQAKYKKTIKENIGCYVIYNYNNVPYYASNDQCKSEKNLVSKTEAENILGIDLTLLESF